MAPSPTIRRLLKETSELSASSKNPNPAFHAAPVSDNDLHEWHFTLLGPPSPSPYAGGLYHGRISLPPSYPLKPPNFRFLTPSGRFEVNREICLSISGFHEETWMPAWGVRTALTALRSFMAEQGTAGQVGGLEAPKEVRERLAKESRGWKCAECGGRSNEETMREWWEACAEKGVKVGEDVGLEALPEGLTLEAKTPGQNAVSENKGKEKMKEENKHEAAVKATTQAILHDTSNGSGPQTASESTTPTPTSSTSSTSSPTIPRTGSIPLTQQAALSTHPPTSTHQTNQPTQPQPKSHQQPTRPQPESAFNSNPITRAVPTGLRTLPLAEPPSFNFTARPQRQPNGEEATLTIDRAIYVVFLALCIMVLKKIFYPAVSRGDWDDWALIKE